MKPFCLDRISESALSKLAKDGVADSIAAADSILVRSSEMKGMDIPNNILAIARAGAGVNNIPVEECAKKGIVVFNTPGANANAVKELVLCALFLSSRDIIGGNRWISEHKDDEMIAKSAEKAKKAFAGHEIMGKTIAIVGLGVIGVMVANSCLALGMKVRGYDPYLSIDNARRLSKDVSYFEHLEEALSGADFVSIHVPLSPSTKGLFGKKEMGLMQNAVLLNFSRDALVDEASLLVALQNGSILRYVSDFATPALAKLPSVILLPHLGASTVEAEDNCAAMAIEELSSYLSEGSISHSVNYPDLHVGKKEAEKRVCVLHLNVPGAISKITSSILKYNSNIASFVNKSRGEYAYSVFDVDGEVDAASIEAIEGIIKVRIL